MAPILPLLGGLLITILSHSSFGQTYLRRTCCLKIINLRNWQCIVARDTTEKLAILDQRLSALEGVETKRGSSNSVEEDNAKLKEVVKSQATTLVRQSRQIEALKAELLIHLNATAARAQLGAFWMRE